MGSLRKPALSSVALALRDALGLSTFVETGTYLGESTSWAAEHFDRVVTIEIDPDTQAKAKATVGPRRNVAYLVGDSAETLPSVLPRLGGTSLFWLDAHKGGGHFGEGDDCPVLSELATINSSRFAHVVFIDDARGFTAPPPDPFDPAKWPTLLQVLDAARSKHPVDVVLFEDVLMCVPEDAGPVLREAVRRVRPRL